MDFITPDNCVGFLQEYCQKTNKALPVYTETGTSGNDHCKEFKISCTIENYTLSGTGFTKKAAKKKAATEMVYFLHSKQFFNKTRNSSAETNVPEVDGLPEVNIPQETSSETIPVNPIGALQEYSTKNQLRLPVYEEVVGVSKQFTISCSFENIVTYGSGPQKKMAKTAAAAEMLKLYREKKEGLSSTVKTEEKKVFHTTMAVAEDENIVKEAEIIKSKNAEEKEAEIIKSKNAEESKTESEIPTDDINRFRDMYHKMSNKDPEKWLKIFCDTRNIDITLFNYKKHQNNTKKVFAIEVPSESVNLEWEGNTEEEAKRECCKVVGFMLLMKHINEFQYLFKNHSKRNNKNKVKARENEARSELKPFVHLENWLNIACQKSNMINPVFEYQLIDDFYEAKCRLLLQTTKGTAESKKEAKKIATAKMQKYVLELANIKEEDDDLLKSRKVVEAMVQVSSQLKQEKQINLDEVIEAYKKLTGKLTKPTSSNKMYTNFYSFLEGPSVTEIVNLDIDEINNGGFKYIENLVTEQNLILEKESFNMSETQDKTNNNHYRNSKQSQYLSVIRIQKPNSHKLSFTGVGTTKSESLEKATFSALVQLKTCLFRKSTQIENLIFLDTIPILLDSTLKF